MTQSGQKGFEDWYFKSGVHLRAALPGQDVPIRDLPGVRILRFSPRRVCLAQGRRLLDLTLAPRDAGHPLRAPQNGRMSGCIRESCAARMRLRLREDGETVLDLGSARAAYEFVPPPQAHNPATAAAY